MSQGFTTVRYGNVTLYRCVTRRYTQDEVLDASGTDLRCMKHTIAVTGFLTGHMAGTYSPGGGTSGSVQFDYTADGTGIDPLGFANIRHLQMRRQLPPRQSFSMTVGDVNGDGTSGQILIGANPAPANMTPNVIGQNPRNGNTNLAKLDLNNGPVCTSFVVTRVTGNETFEVEATFEIHLVECDQYGNVPNNNSGILNNRWSCQSSYDSLMRETRTYTGELILASANLNAQQCRWVVVPPLIQMFRRENLNLTASEDGLKLGWSCTDVEISQSAPYPARRWDVQHKLYGRDAMMGISSIRVQLWGDSNVNKADLIEAGLYACTAKMFGVTPNNIGVVRQGFDADYWGQFFVEDLEFEDPSTDENSIIISMRVRRTPQGQNAILVAAADLAQSFGKPFKSSDLQNTAYARDNRQNYDRAYTFGAFTGDTPEYQSPAASIIGIFATYLQTPCNDYHATYQKGQNPSNLSLVDNRPAMNLNGLPFSSNPIPYQGTIVASNAPVTVPNPFVSASHKKNAYIQWQIDNVYKTRTTRIQMPIANMVPGPNTYVNPGYSPSSAVVQVAGFQTIRIVRVRAMRIGKEPEFPSPDDVTKFPPFPAPNSAGNTPIIQTFITRKLRIGTPRVSPFGQTVYYAEAEYRFGLSRSPNPGEQLALGNDKWGAIGQRNTDSDGTLTNSDWTPGTQ